ncbi:MAG: SDH family Clp fold serine proteinase [Methanothrix sp.]
MAPIGRDIIKKIEKNRESKIIVYFTGDRPFDLTRAVIAEDAVRYLYDHLLGLEFEEGKKKRIDLFLYSRGGDVSVPWRIVSMIREFCDEFNVLIPYKAHSAATLLSLGADTIIMGRKAELGPIDPTLSRKSVGGANIPPQDISVEDVNSFVSFIRDTANVNDQEAVAQLLNGLISQVGPLNLGSVNRQSNHIRMVSRKLLTTRNEKIDESKLNTVIETLIEKIYFHGHAIARREANDIGLKVEFSEGELERLMWDLYLVYEEVMKLNEPLDPVNSLQKQEQMVLPDLPIALIESAEMLHVFRINIDLKNKRQAPPNLNLNLQLQLPPSIDPQKLPAQGQKILNDMMTHISSLIPQLVQQEIQKQSPLIGYDARQYGGKWIREE